MLSPAETSYIRIKIIRRFGDSWLYLAFFICAYIIRRDYKELVEYPDACSQDLIRFLNAYYVGYELYLGFLGVTLIGFVFPRLETIFRMVNAFFFVVYFFGIFIYANYALHQLTDYCKGKYVEIKLFAIIYIISWYSYIATRLIMVVMYTAKRNFSGQQGTEGIALFVEAE